MQGQYNGVVTKEVLFLNITSYFVYSFIMLSRLMKSLVAVPKFLLYIFIKEF
jgi:hypothetical protein